MRMAFDGKSTNGLKFIGMVIDQNREIAIGSSNPDKLYDQIKEMYPNAKLSKHKDYVLIEGNHEKL